MCGPTRECKSMCLWKRIVFFALESQCRLTARVRRSNAPQEPWVTHPQQTHATPCVSMQRTKPELLKGPPKKKGKKIAAGAGSGNESDSKKSKKDQ